MRDARIFASHYWNMSSMEGGQVAVAIVAVFGGRCGWECDSCPKRSPFEPTTEGDSMSPHPHFHQPSCCGKPCILVGDWAAYVGGSNRTWQSWMAENDVRSNGEKLDEETANFLFRHFFEMPLRPMMRLEYRR